MNKLTAEKCREQIAEWERMMSVSDIAVMVERHLQAYRIALPILEQQERGEDEWIEFTGGVCPVEGDTRVQVRWSDGSVVTGQASSYGWTGLCFGRIEAYRIIPEQSTNQNGEQ